MPDSQRASMNREIGGRPPGFDLGTAVKVGLCRMYRYI